jgi:glycosyltransferase involved in cell wall biosynthesis
MTATVIIPTTGSADLVKSVESVLNQTYPTTCYVVCDGEEFKGKTKVILDEYSGNKNIKISYLPINVGANGFYGHRIYAAFTHLVNTEYVLYLDQDCWIDEDHVQNCIDTINKNNLQWSYSLRKILDKDGTYLCDDNCESLGKWPVFSGEYNHIDTNCYCLKTNIAVNLCQVWHGGWGQDRVWFKTLQQYFPNYDTTGKHTVNYRLAGNDGSVKDTFFEYGNAIMKQKYNGEFPWKKI